MAWNDDGRRRGDDVDQCRRVDFPHMAGCCHGDEKVTGGIDRHSAAVVGAGNGGGESRLVVRAASRDHLDILSRSDGKLNSSNNGQRVCLMGGVKLNIVKDIGP